jgi:serine/threonine-protein kinase
MSETRTQKGRLDIRQTVEGEAALLRLSGAIDETFTGFDPSGAAHIVMELGGLTRITSYGVRQWIRGRDQLGARQLYYVNCPPFFIDQLNMVMNFGGHGQVVTAFAPFTCSGCKAEQWTLIDVLARHDELAGGAVPDEKCPKCAATMEMDELPETYFGFVKAAGARAIAREVAPLLSSAGLYRANAPVADAAPAGERAQVQKLVHDRVTYFRISGTVDKRFRARSLIEGTEGEVVLDLKDLGGIADDGRDEWQRLRAGLQQRASLVTLVDVPPPVLEAIDQGKLSFGGAVVYSVIAPHECEGCGRASDESMVLGASAAGGRRVCSACGGSLKYTGKESHQKLAQRLTSGPILAATREVIERREDLLSRARIEAEAAPSEVRAPRQKGAILGKYEIVRALSVGGMAEVFLAVQKGIGGFEKPVALKRIRRSVLERRHFAVEQFLNEAKIAATLAHPNIAQIFDVGEEDGILYLAMEYVQGRDARMLLRRLKDRYEKLPLGTALYICQQVARALHHAYTATDLNGRQLKAVHRDVSPHNILIGFDGSVKLVDFGVATSATTREHEPGQVAGKHNYMSPEQLQAQPLDARSDLFSLGVCLYELLSGERPFSHETREQTLEAVNEARYTPLSQLRPDLPKSIDKLVARLLARKPADRIADGNKVAEELVAFAAQSTTPIGNDWLRGNMQTLFPNGTAEQLDADGNLTPRSDSFSLEPTANRLRKDTPQPKVANDAAPSRGVGYTSGSLPSFDERTLSQIVSPQMAKNTRFWMVAALLLLVACVAILWWRY